MNPTIFIPIIFLWIFIFIILRNRRKVALLRKIINRRKSKGSSNMKKLAAKFIDKECIISSFDGNQQYHGVIKEISDNAILLETKGNIEAVNLDFIIRIREYPKNKKGNKKSVVID